MDILLHHLQLRREQLTVHLHLVFPLLHAELQLHLAVLQREHLVGPGVELVPQALNLELENVVRHHLILLLLHSLLHSLRGGVRLEVDLVELVRHLLRLTF